MRSPLVFLILFAAACASTSAPPDPRIAAWEKADQASLHRDVLDAAKHDDRATAEAAGTIYLRRFGKGLEAGELRTTILPWALCGTHKTPQESLRDLDALASNALPAVASCVLVTRSDLRAALGDLEGARADLQRADDLVAPFEQLTCGTDFIAARDVAQRQALLGRPAPQFAQADALRDRAFVLRFRAKGAAQADLPPEALTPEAGFVDVVSLPAGADVSRWRVHAPDGARFVIDPAGRVIAIDSDRVACLPWERLFECARRSAASR